MTIESNEPRKTEEENEEPRERGGQAVDDRAKGLDTSGPFDEPDENPKRKE